MEDRTDFTRSLNPSSDATVNSVNLNQMDIEQQPAALPPDPNKITSSSFKVLTVLFIMTVIVFGVMIGVRVTAGNESSSNQNIARNKNEHLPTIEPPEDKASVSPQYAAGGATNHPRYRLLIPTDNPSGFPSDDPSNLPSRNPESGSPSNNPSDNPSNNPQTRLPSNDPSRNPESGSPFDNPSGSPESGSPSDNPSSSPQSGAPSNNPSNNPQTRLPSNDPSSSPHTVLPSGSPQSGAPSNSPETTTPSNSPKIKEAIWGSPIGLSSVGSPFGPYNLDGVTSKITGIKICRENDLTTHKYDKYIQSITVYVDGLPKSRAGGWDGDCNSLTLRPNEVFDGRGIVIDTFQGSKVSALKFYTNQNREVGFGPTYQLPSHDETIIDIKGRAGSENVVNQLQFKWL